MPDPPPQTEEAAAAPLARVLQAAMDVDNLWHRGRQANWANQALCDALDAYWLSEEPPESAGGAAGGGHTAGAGRGALTDRHERKGT